MGNLSASNSCIGIVDYGKVDVWSLGCVLFRLMHGASPFEMEFVKNDYGGDYYGYGRRRSGASRKVEEQHQQYGLHDNQTEGHLHDDYQSKVVWIRWFIALRGSCAVHSTFNYIYNA